MLRLSKKCSNIFNKSIHTWVASLVEIYKLDIVNDDLLMLPPRVTGVDPSLAMVEEARFLSLRSILTMRIIMMKIMLKKLKNYNIVCGM